MRKERAVSAVGGEVYDELRRAAEDARCAHVELARVDSNAFCSYVLRDEEAGEPIEQSPVHETWHRLAGEHDRLILWSFIEGGKSTQLTIGRVLWALGCNPNLRCVILSNNQANAKKFVTAIKSYIEKSRELHDVFPDLQPGEQWTTTQITVRRRFGTKDPSVVAVGAGTKIQSARIDLMVIDDLLEYQNVRTAKLRQEMLRWLKAKAVGRVSKRGRLIWLGNAFYPDDAMHEMARNPRYASFKFPVLNPVTKHPRVRMWPLERIERVSAELGPFESQRQLHCVARDDADKRFKREWLELGLRRGEGKRLTEALRMIPHGYKVYTGVDLAVGLQKRRRSGYTALFTIIVHPDASREVLMVESGKWSGPEIIQKIVSTYNRYGGIIIVENNGAQEYLLQFVRQDTAVPVQPFTTGANKAHPEFGVESLATEMANGKWIVPNIGGAVEPGVADWIADLDDYSPLAHVGDVLMASWFAREGARTGKIGAKPGKHDLGAR
jgi:hypothetical protein